MEVAAALRMLESKGKPATAKIYQRHGVSDRVLGVTYEDLGALTKKIGVNHGLALALFESGVHEARVLATKVADPEKASSSQLGQWLSQAKDYVLADAVSALAAKTPLALGFARDLVKSKHEWTAAAGWNIFASAALEGRLEESEAKRLVATVRRDIHRQPNRVRHAMNAVLIAIGGSMPALTELALVAAHAIGKVEVDHGQTGCVTPAAAPYIEKMLARRNKASAPPKVAKKVAKR
ncbi:MAG TPA: DNA alkylation repair protein [Polyangiaceae bacterium]|jgi:3-methyladenine DNA glycosylase AlkD|nr:DNA alkylation repair protein [Polyangiaceae bacterium]